MSTPQTFAVLTVLKGLKFIFDIFVSRSCHILHSLIISLFVHFPPDKDNDKQIHCNNLQTSDFTDDLGNLLSKMFSISKVFY